MPTELDVVTLFSCGDAYSQGPFPSITEPIDDTAWQSGSGFSFSPDDKLQMLARMDQNGSDIMLVEGFR
jgi:hypothetical protein